MDHAVTVDVFYHVSANVTNGQKIDSWIQDRTTNTYPAECNDVTTCAADVLGGHYVIVWVFYPTHFSVTCPGGTEQVVEYTATCPTTSLSSAFTVNVKGW